MIYNKVYNDKYIIIIDYILLYLHYISYIKCYISQPAGLVGGVGRLGPKWEFAGEREKCFAQSASASGPVLAG